MKISFKSIWYAALLMSVLIFDVALAEDTVLEHTYRPLAGKGEVNLQEAYAGQVLLIVNTASKCGLAPQFEGLEALNARYGDRGFSVLGFPSGDFREQEFEDEAQIQEFCTLTYGVKFPMFERVHVAGAQATGLFRDLIAATGEEPQWNFHKYLVGRDGRVLANWGSRTLPEDPQIVAAIERALAEDADSAR